MYLKLYVDISVVCQINYLVHVHCCSMLCSFFPKFLKIFVKTLHTFLFPPQQQHKNELKLIVTKNVTLEVR